ncbi:MAG: hypothetical protein JO257_14385, partial [Deltaproteobacteria bacterium]|nr:hypothetical protein [Deltaproteobacteria bacterium]
MRWLLVLVFACNGTDTSAIEKRMAAREARTAGPPGPIGPRGDVGPQ